MTQGPHAELFKLRVGQKTPDKGLAHFARRAGDKDAVCLSHDYLG
jgi:hypothetical protein